VVVSQWKVESGSTTELMVEFYKAMRRNAGAHQSRISKAEALRRAGLSLLKTRRYRHPFYWAPFVIVGDSN
jgi:CHAT domain-containing protein